MRTGNVALMTEEDFTEPCKAGGRIVAADITSSLGGEGATNSTPAKPFRMTGRLYHQGLRQVGYYSVVGTNTTTNPSSLSWDTAWRGTLVYLFDMSRGIEILRLKGGPGRAGEARHRALAARPVDRLAKVPVSGLTPGSLICPLFAAQ